MQAVETKKEFDFKKRVLNESELKNRQNGSLYSKINEIYKNPEHLLEHI